MWRFNFRKIKEWIFLSIILFLSLLMIFPLLHIVYTVFANGIGTLLSHGPVFITGTLSEGGIGPAIVGTLILTFLASLIGIPVAFVVGIYAYEHPDSIIGRATTALLEIMLEFPTILVGLFVTQIIVVPMGTYSAIAGAFSLAIILMPYVSVYTKESMNQIPFTYREAAYGLGLSKVKTVFMVIAPIAKRGILAGLLISIAKVAGETAPLLFTAGGLYQSYPQGVSRPIGAIPLLIYTLVQSPSPQDHAMAWGAALVLMLIFLGVFIPLRLSIKEVKL
jgi:phosphate transport system permease protein